MDTMHTEKVLTPIGWKRWQRYLFRFWSIYFILYFYSLPFLDFLWEPLVEWTGRSIGMPIPNTGPNGSGDTLFNYIQLLCLLILSAASCLIWSAVSKRKQYNTLWVWTVTLVRYALVFYMFSYGVSKIALMQFPTPSLARLMQPYGESSPMGLAWTFIGASPAFSIFTGIIELTAGILLLFRRTTVFGTLFSMTVVTNIVAMNFCYDIPVKLFSTHLLLACIFILSPFISHVWSFFFAAKAVSLPKYVPILTRYPTARIGLKIVVGALLCFMTFSYIFNNNRYTTAPPLYGIYDAELFVLDGDTLTAANDTNRWQFITIDKWERGAIKRINVPANRYDLKIDTKKLTMQYNADDSGWVLQYDVPDSNHLIVRGKLSGHYVYAALCKKDLRNFLLINRGFHWINEYPFNK